MTMPFRRSSSDANQFETASPAANASRPNYDDALRDTERLLKYAAEVGIEVDDLTMRHILAARSQSASGASDETEANLLAALTKLTKLLKPVSAESLRACANAQRKTVHGYLRWAVSLAVLIVPFSIVSFVTSGIADAIRKDIETANGLAVKIATQLQVSPGPAATAGATQTPGAASAAATADAAGQSLSPALLADVVTQLQQLASITRWVDARARRLNAFVFMLEQDPFARIRGDAEAIHQKFQLPAELPMHLREAFDERIRVYQDVRYFAQNLLDDISAIYGALAACLLPVLYALLGTCAYLLRSFEQQTATRTFVASTANSARFLIAGIGGAVVGLFNNFTVTQGASIPPLAIAFLVGYAVDVFFSFLESLLQTFTKSKSGTLDPQPAR
jgi:hypothetical protein